VGYYCNAFSNDLKGDITQLTAGTSNVKDEQGMEIFYDYAITPAVRPIPSYQHIWEPLTAQVATKQSEAMYSWCVPLWRFDLSRLLGFLTAKWRLKGQVAQQQFHAVHDRFGSEADMTTNLPNVRFGLESGRESKWSWIKMVVG
jgi:hypothetical protein